MEVSVAEAAAILGVSVDTVRRRVALGGLAYRRTPNRLVIFLDEADLHRRSGQGAMAEIQHLREMVQGLEEERRRLREELQRAEAIVDRQLEVLRMAAARLINPPVRRRDVSSDETPEALRRLAEQANVHWSAD